MDKRLGKVNWGKGNSRLRTSEANWKKVYSWNASSASKRAPVRRRVFVASLADWLDPEVPAEWLADLLKLVMECKHLDFLLLTKRPELFRDRIEAAFCSIGPAFDQYTPIEEREDWERSDSGKLHLWLVKWKYGVSIPDNVWVGTSVEDQTRADERIPALIKIPANVRFLSCEPLLEPVHIEPYLLTSAAKMAHNSQFVGNPSNTDKVHWVIAGGESGPEARAVDPDWIRSLRDQCDEWGTAFFFKQWGGLNKKLSGRELDGRIWAERPF